MRTKIATITAVTASLILSAAGAVAAEARFQSPTTERAQQAQRLLEKAAVALNAKVSRADEGKVSNLWLYPTADNDTVFAQYVLTTNKASVSVSEQHFELLKMNGDRIVEQRDLTRAGGESALDVKRPNRVRDWSASIGTGHATGNSGDSTSAVGAPASAHWSASIGTGQVTRESTRRLYAEGKAQTTHAGKAHWTSKVGTAHAADLSSYTQSGKVTS